ncbi:hypothetical protein [[Flexibacter] sp. ATCC 35208]|uniref:hypothetical protein n=1 Tax=[Flexibacter] sp. ATCC 35208 TaxID=1936242 RepID=UPI0009CEDEAE|nr:hypothetical protein [[Flexibacter] sp. ATCC 35208]OMP80497.1 hypothetical protein BW716_03015 [[Flexibacter] sp. ATCC 35208]
MTEVGTSPYVYALNQPTQAVDPDGNLVIFVNGNHYGDDGRGYWQTTAYRQVGERLFQGATGPVFIPVYGKRPVSFDGMVMDQLNDHKPQYYDGSMGGYHPLAEGKRFSSLARGRESFGYGFGKRDAKSIIESLARDKNGNIIETIKIITHSMGGAFGKGLVKALKEYIKENHLERQVKITLVADFDPYQAGDLTADADIKTMQFIHKNNWNISGMGWLANEREKGDVETPQSKSPSSDHTIFSFFADISQLAEGTYKWNGSNWVKQ